MKQLRFRIEQAGLVLLSAVARLIPVRATPPLGALLGRIAWHVSPRRRRIAIANLELAFSGEMDAWEQMKVARATYAQFGRLLLEGLMFPRLRRLAGSEGHSTDSASGGLVRYEGLEHIRNAYASGRGVLLFSAHFGNWELVALMQGFLGMPLTMITRPLDNPHLERLLASHRAISGNTIVHKKSSLRPMLGAVNSGGGVAIVIDQNVRDGSGVFVDFFGRKASTTPSLALVALRTGAAVIPVFAFPRSDGSYRVEYLPEVVPERSGDRKADVLHLTGRCTAIIETAVRRDPGSWLWMHERWKTRPPEERRKTK